ncbi:protein SRG1 isoform X2 [Cajanus cajan]|uniref:Protein SRG1 n=2 Tax=Cajanus cajan TaxID=3821 RepID=A0A151R5S7_CAJCA|nr:protein SRG1 isoform X2 [Cajanus cajan]XP_020204547.1 protein SRG1 isoform X2 [Cajanus cajan]XP_020204548.1 protein SRG1 isoform X2 [Cajanus cajan]XP_029125383.1 protein SRG1 isoform X2 [Cajanus cajan]KYP37735.1 Protein SRG1 [Cajanus cajan]
MDAEIPNLGSSLPVPSVKELVKQPMKNVPERYIHPNEDPLSVPYTTSLPQIPVIDLSKLLSEDATELEKLDHACKEWGFFQLINHGVDPSLIENVKIGVQEFFNLPMEEKKLFWQKPGEIEGFGQTFVVSEEQKLNWADIFTIHTFPLKIRNPRLFPSIPQPFRDNLESYILRMKIICITIMGLVEKLLKIKPNELIDLFEDIDMGQSIRMNYYPPCPQPENVIGLNPHSDAGALTILLQLNEMEGLQIRKDGMWIPIKPHYNAFVINVGDFLEILTNGIYRSVEHRAIINNVKERMSLAVFHKPDLNRVIGPVPTLVKPGRPAMFKRFVVADYYKGYFSRELQGKSYLDTMRIQNEDFS